jgi:hypothetical protein
MKARVLLFLLVVCVSYNGRAQSQDSLPVPENYKNVIRWNLTPTLVLGTGSWAFGYERVVKPHQSFSTNLGFIQLPQVFKSVLDSLQITRHNRRRGFSFAADYRFYNKKRNKWNAPDGLYWGPYFTSYYFDTQTDIQIFANSNSYGKIIADSQILFLMAGVELGYQFTFGKNRRWTCDLILVGPSIRYDNIKLKLGADVQGDIDLNEDYLEGIYDALTTLLPGFGDLLETGEISTSGITSGFGVGYRYVVQIGFRF